jgi:hypothetical protein
MSGESIPPLNRLTFEKRHAKGGGHRLSLGEVAEGLVVVICMGGLCQEKGVPVADAGC